MLLNHLHRIFPLGANIYIAVDLNKSDEYRPPENIFEVIYNSLNILLLNTTQLQTKEADFVICPKIAEFSLTRIERVDALIQKGYEAASEMTDIIKKAAG